MSINLTMSSFRIETALHLAQPDFPSAWLPTSHSNCACYTAVCLIHLRARSSSPFISISICPARRLTAPSHGSASKFAASFFKLFNVRLSSHLLIRSSMLPILIIRCSTAALPCTVTLSANLHRSFDPDARSIVSDRPVLQHTCSLHRCHVLGVVGM